MEVFRTHVAGVDVHKNLLEITVLVGAADAEPAVHHLTTDCFTESLEECGRKLLALGVKEVAMESTGIFWRPVHNVWSKQGFQITLANATHIKNVPGRKTDKVDATWIAKLHRYGLIQTSYIPTVEFQKMRSLNRHRTNLVEDLARVKNRVQKVLEDGNVKLGSVLSDVFGVSGLAVLDAIAKGETDSNELLEQIKTKVKKPKEEIRKSLKHCLTETHQFQIAEFLIQFRHLQQSIDQVETQLAGLQAPYTSYINRLLDIPGVRLTLARGIIAEATVDMKHFANDRKFAAWAGVAPGNYQSAGTRKKVRVRHGNPAFKKILVQIAQGAVKTKNSYFMTKCNKLTIQTGSRNKAIMGIANRIARVIFHMLRSETLQYKEHGPILPDDTEKAIKKKIAQLKALGVEVSYDSIKKINAKRTVDVTI